MDEQQYPTVTHGLKTFVLPFADLFRPLTCDEEAEARASYARVGIMSPVFVYDSERYGRDCVIDGANRLRIAQDMGLDLRVEKLRATDDVARTMAEDANIARRQVTPADARAAREKRIERVVAARAEGKSIRAIAAEVGTNPKQVRRDLEAAGGGTAPTCPDKVTGTDGKTYPAARRHSDEHVLAVPTRDDLRDDDQNDAPDRGDAWEPEDEPGADGPPPMDDTLPQPSRDTSRPGRPAWMTGGSKHDPDHPFADVLAKFTAATAALTKAINDPKNDRLKVTLTNLSTVVRKTQMVDYAPTVIAGAEVKGGRVRFVGLGPLRTVIRRLGNRQKPMTVKELLGALNEPELEDCE